MTRWNMENSSLAANHLFKIKINIHLNMFCAVVLNWVVKEVDGTNIVTLH